MKKILFVVVIMIAVADVAFAQTISALRVTKDNLIKATLVNLEKRMWQARKDRDDKYLSILTTEDAINVGDFGAVNKTSILKSVARSQCQIKSYKMEDISVTMFNVNTALLTYKAEEESVCGGITGSSSAWASSLYLKQNSKWLNAFHQETPANQPK